MLTRMLTPLFSRQRQQEAVPVLTVHAILKGGRFVETGTDLPKGGDPRLRRRHDSDFKAR
jgi:hypothetical protein